MSTPPAPTGTAAPAATARGVPTVVMAGRTTTVVAQFSVVTPPPVVPLKITITQPAADRPHASAVKVEGDHTPFVLKGFIEGPAQFYDCYFVLYTAAPDYSAKYMLSIRKKVKLKKEFREEVNLTKLTTPEGKTESLPIGIYFVALYACPADTPPAIVEKLSDADPNTRAIREIAVVAAPPPADGYLKITCHAKSKGGLSRRKAVGDARVTVIDALNIAQTKTADPKGAVAFTLAPGPLRSLRAVSSLYGSRDVVKPETMVIVSKKTLENDIEFPPHATVNLKAKVDGTRKKPDVHWKLINSAGAAAFETSSPLSEAAADVAAGDYVVVVDSLEYDVVRFEPANKVSVKAGASADVFVYVREKTPKHETDIKFLEAEVRIAGVATPVTNESPSRQLGGVVSSVILPPAKSLAASLRCVAFAPPNTSVTIYAEASRLRKDGIRLVIDPPVLESLGIELRGGISDRDKEKSDLEGKLPAEIMMSEDGFIDAAFEFSMQAVSLEKCLAMDAAMDSLLITCDVIIHDTTRTTIASERSSLIVGLIPAPAVREKEEPSDLPAPATNVPADRAVLPREIADENEAIAHALKTFATFKAKRKAKDTLETGWFSLERRDS